MNHAIELKEGKLTISIPEEKEIREVVIKSGGKDVVYLSQKEIEKRIRKYWDD